MRERERERERVGALCGKIKTGGWKRWMRRGKGDALEN
jgi:hypothetical protein